MKRNNYSSKYIPPENKTKKKKKIPQKIAHGQILYKHENTLESQLTDFNDKFFQQETGISKEKKRPPKKKLKTKKESSSNENETFQALENVNPSNPYDSLLASLQWDGTHQELFRKRVFEQEGMEEEIEEELNEKKYFQEPETSDKFTSKKSLNLEELDKTENQETITDENEDETELQTKELNELDEKEKEELLTEDENKKDPFLAHFSETELTEDQVKTWKRPKFQSFQTLQLGEILGTNSPPSIQSLEECETHMKKRLLDQWESSSFKDFSSLQIGLYSLMSEYNDIFFAKRNFENANQIRVAYVLHCLNHITKTRDKVLKGTEKINRADVKIRDTLEIKDQGFTRPKILILLPFRHSVIQVVDLFIALCPKSQQEQILNKKKFYQEFGLEEEDVPPVNRPEEYAKIFEGNVDDYFRIGISFSRKAIKLYSEFYSSDLIIASPLGLRLAMGEPKSKKFDCDFLSSIEIMILDQTDIFLMQNWDHLNFIFDYLNTIPKKPRNTDFSRVKEWYLNGWAKYYRQTIICSSFITPELNNLWNRNCTSMKGAFKIRPLSYQNGSIQQVIPKIRQMFFKFDCNDPAQLDDIRFKYFVEKIFPSYRNGTISHLLIFIPSYFDYIRIRNLFKEEELSYCQLCEYTTGTNIARNRSNFFHGRKLFLLFTERFHFYHRYKIRGVHHILFYSPPTYAQFYPELLNCLEEAESTSTFLFSKFDRLSLERIVGSSKALRMIESEKNTFMFC